LTRGSGEANFVGMATYLVSYDLRGTDETSDDYKRLIEKIKSYSWAKVTYSDWMIVTTKTTTQIRDELWAYMDKNDRLLVATVNAPASWAGTIPEDVSDWMKANLHY
jgi:hypothetical protein